jgi:hypothetical protein
VIHVFLLYHVLLFLRRSERKGEREREKGDRERERGG